MENISNQMTEEEIKERFHIFLPTLVKMVGKNLTINVKVHRVLPASNEYDTLWLVTFERELGDRTPIKSFIGYKTWCSPEFVRRCTKQKNPIAYVDDRRGNLFQLNDIESVTIWVNEIFYFSENETLKKNGVLTSDCLPTMKIPIPLELVENVKESVQEQDKYLITENHDILNPFYKVEAEIESLRDLETRVSSIASRTIFPDGNVKNPYDNKPVKRRKNRKEKFLPKELNPPVQEPMNLDSEQVLDSGQQGLFTDLFFTNDLPDFVGDFLGSDLFDL